jgi:subtilisin family serine protease
MGAAQVHGGVVNMSFGGYTHDNMEPAGLKAALQFIGPEVVLVAAAGNHGSTDPFWPAAFENVVAVAAVDSTDKAAVVPASFTNRGSWVDFCAPGVDIHSAYVKGNWPGEPPFGGYARWSGTSFAAPQLVAAIALRAKEKGITTRNALAELRAELSPLPGHADMGLLYIPHTDVVFRP